MDNTFYVVVVLILLVLQIYQQIQIRNLKITNSSLWVALTLFATNIGVELDKLKSKENKDGEQKKEDIKS